jgi:hypothetical protein
MFTKNGFFHPPIDHPSIQISLDGISQYSNEGTHTTPVTNIPPWRLGDDIDSMLWRMNSYRLVA